MKWVVCERPVIDRIACPWLIARFIDKELKFLFVPPNQILKVAEGTEATPYDASGIGYTHVGEGCSFDTFVSKPGRDRDPQSWPSLPSFAVSIQIGEISRSYALVRRTAGDLDRSARWDARRPGNAPARRPRLRRVLCLGFSTQGGTHGWPPMIKTPTA